MSEEKAVTVQRAPVAMGDRGIELRSMDDLGRFCDAVARSGLAPKSLDTPAKIAVAVQTGMEAGLSPMAALRSVVVIGNLPSWKGEAALALIRQSGAVIGVSVRGEGDKREAVVRFQRAGMEAAEEVTFTVTDAKRAGLWGKQGPWSQYPDDMLTWRAVARASKRYFSDVLMGLAIAEEVQDYPAAAVQVKDVTPPAEPLHVFFRLDHDAPPRVDLPLNRGELRGEFFVRGVDVDLTRLEPLAQEPEQLGAAIREALAVVRALTGVDRRHRLAQLAESVVDPGADAHHVDLRNRRPVLAHEAQRSTRRLHRVVHVRVVNDPDDVATAQVCDRLVIAEARHVHRQFDRSGGLERSSLRRLDPRERYEALVP